MADRTDSSEENTLTTCSSYFFEANFQVVLGLLLIVRERFINQKLVLDVNLKKKIIKGN